MTRVSKWKLTILALLALVLVSGTAFAQTVGGYQLISQLRINATTVENTYKATLKNGGQAIQGATATLSAAPGVQIVDGSLSFGPLAPGQSGVSTDSFVIRLPRSSASGAPRLVWNVVVQPVGGGGAATKLRVRPLVNVRAGDPITVVVEALDASDVLDTNFAGPVTLVNLQAAVVGNGQTAFDFPVAPVIGGGLATFTGLSISNAADGYTFGAQAVLSGNLVTDAIDAPFNVTASHLTVASVIANHRAGTLFNATVEARDANNTVAENFVGNVNLNAAATGGSNFNGGQQTAPGVAGAATFVGLALNNAADVYTATASAAGPANGVSNAFNVSYSTLSVLPVANVRAGDPFNAQVQALDANGVLAENFGTTLANGSDVVLINLQAAVVASGQTTFNAPVVPSFSSGTATFTGLAINNAADGYTFSAQASSGGNLVTDAINAAFNVTASHLTVASVIANHRAGTLFNATVEARDANNTVAENFAGNVNLNASATGGSNFNGGQQTTPGVSGSATFVGLALNNAADVYTATASAAGVTNGVSNAFNVSFTTLSVLAVANVRSGDPFNAQVEARDANGALAENFGTTPSNGSDLSLVNLQSAVLIFGQTAFNAAVAPSFSSGTATFTGLGINNAADGYTFSAQASSGGNLVTDAINAAFNVTASHLTVASVIANHRAGTLFNATVEARDANNTVAENFVSNVNLNAAATGGSNFNGGQQTTPGVSGSATFVGLALNNAADVYTATASAAGPANGVSNAFNVSFTTLSVQAVGNVGAGAPFNAQVQALDANGVLAENFGTTLANGSDLVLINLQAAVPAFGQVAFNAPVVPGFSGGTATFTALAINNAADGYTFSAQASSGGSPVVDAINAAFNVTASHLAVTTVVANHAAGTPFNLTVQARDGNNNAAENFTSNVSVNAAATGGANFNGGQQTVAAASGVATFNGLVLNTAADGYVITASAAGLSSGLSNAFNVTGGGGGGGGAESLELSLSQSAIGAGGTSNIAALVLDDLGDPITPSPDINYSILADEGSSGPPPTVLNGQILTSATTRGGYILQGQVNGTAVTDEILFAVTQNAAQSPNAGKFVALAVAEGTIAAKLAELFDAFQDGNLAAIPGIKTAIQNAAASIPMTGRNAIQRARPVAPETGFLPSLAQLTAGGFPETPADVSFGLLIPQIVAKLDQIRQFYDALPTNPASGGTDSVAALNQLNTELAALQLQLEGLDISPHAVVKHVTAINNLIRSTMPLQMNSVAAKISSVLTANGLASLDSTPGEFFDGTTPAATALALASPDAFYAHEQPAFFGLGGLMGGMSLQMNLVNRIYGPLLAQVARMMLLLGVNDLLQNYLNVAQMEGLITGGSLSFFTFNAPDSLIEGSGMNRENVASNEVFLVGGAAINAVKGVIDAFNPSNVDSFDDLYDFFEGIVNALQAAGQAYDQAEQPPSSVEFGCFLDGGTNPNCSTLVYPAGFEAVSGCSGFLCFQFPVLVLYHNKDTGHWASGVFNFVPE